MPANQEIRLPAVINERLLEIPDYQRPYAWSHKQLEDLWEDLDLLGPAGSHYAGTLVLRDVLLPGGEPKASLADDGATLRHCEVVDGQQRLTTCLLLLDRIRRRLNDLDVLGVQNAAAMAARIRTTYGMVSVDRASLPKLRLGEDLNSYWVDVVLGDQQFVGPALIAGQERLRNATSFFDGKLADLRGTDPAGEFERLKDLQRRVTAGLGFLVYEVQSAAEVGVIFETLNERGRDLSDLEKAKNYLLYLARSIKDGRSEQLADLINKSWADIFRNLSREGRDADNQLLRAHWLATQDPDRRNWKGISSIKARFDRSRYVSGETRLIAKPAAAHDQESAWDTLFRDVTRYVTTLRDCSFYQAEMFDPNAAFEAFQDSHNDVRGRSSALHRSGVVALYRPLLFAARLAHAIDGALYSRIIALCECYSARVFVIRQRRANAGETRLLRLAYELYKGRRSPEGVLEEVTALLWRYAPDSDLKASLESMDENWYGRRGHKYFLYEYELSSSPRPRELRSFQYFTEAAGEQRTTEHILPQNPTPHAACWWDNFTPEEHAALVHSLGNLALTYDNSSYSNHCFDRKRGAPLVVGAQPQPGYAQSTLVQELELAQYEEWTPATIEARQLKLAAWALKRWAVAAPAATVLANEPVDIEQEGTDEDQDVVQDEVAGGASA